VETLSQNLLLGAVQGLTEFLPISSSGHLVLIGELFKLPQENFLFDAILHLATLLAVVVYFYRPILGLITSPLARQNRRLLINLVWATIPAVLAGLLLRGMISSFFEKPLYVAGLMILMGLLLLLMERFSKAKFTLAKLDFTKALGIGIAQAAALLPGLSRLGMTLATGLFYGLKREEATYFSFLMALPVILGAGLISLWRAWQERILSFDLSLWSNALAAFGVALLAIFFLMRYIKKGSLLPFALYLFLVGGGFIIYKLFFV